jgi:adenylate cyclase
MRGFTSISEKLMAAEVVPLLNQYFRLLTDIAFEYEGTVFNMAGDCLMVGFGVPFEQPDATVRAYHTAMKMLASFDELVGEWRGRYGIKAGLGIGVNSGEVIAGNVGSPHFMSYTIIGDAVNVAARLSQRARAGELLFSQKVKAALDAAGENCSAVPLEPSSLRGRSETIDIFWVTGPRQAKTPAD